MSAIISASIDLSKIDKSKIKEHSNGGKYYSIQIFVNDNTDSYGNNVGVCDAQTKEEREAKEKKKYLGNGKVVYSSGISTPQRTEQPQQPAQEPQDDLPF